MSNDGMKVFEFMPLYILKSSNKMIAKKGTHKDEMERILFFAVLNRFTIIEGTYCNSYACAHAHK